ncbi:MAG: MBL fold metallo-hydrolase [Candidatus Methanomethylicia archaeon]|nr:MBL fold metallo-hydrolase [Candidatus Methanomethylicia archaeon]
MNWSVYGFNGVLILLEDISFSIDPISIGFEGDVVLVSHAHGDHIVGLKSKKSKLTSHYTFKLYEAIVNRRINNSNVMFIDDRRINVGEICLEAYDSGHILGSLQFRFEKLSSSIVYTGDFNLIDTTITRRCKILDCDELIIDATYGNPNISFPDRWSIYENLISFVESCTKNGKPPVFKVYAIGKAQEIIALINKFLNMEVLVDSKISRINDVYRSNGFDLKYISILSDEGIESLNSLSLPIVTSSNRLFRMAADKGMPKATATGWALIHNLTDFDVSFPLSSHADFNQIKMYVEESKAKRIYPYGRFSRRFSKWIERNMNIYCKPLYYLV